MNISRFVIKPLYTFGSPSLDRHFFPLLQSLSKYSTNAVSPPRVPSTQHVEPYELATSAFFAGHRPLNIPLMLHGPNKQQIDRAVEMFGQSIRPKEADLDGGRFQVASEHTPVNITFLSKPSLSTQARTLELIQRLKSLFSDNSTNITLHAHPDKPNSSQMELASVKRKRKLKMNKHKYQKRRKLQRALMKRLGK